jgi:hypothetical protein
MTRSLYSLSSSAQVQILYCMENMAADYEIGSPDWADYEEALSSLQVPISGVLVNTEDVEALAQNLREHLQYDGEEEALFWGSVLSRLLSALA